MSLRIAIVHYHARPGGVTSVIARAAAALRESPHRLAVLTGSRPARHAAPAAAQAVPGLDYLRPGSARCGAALTDRLMAAARRALGGRPDLWHVHNHALGKQPALAEAVHILARRGERLVLQLHDFAEDGRSALYAAVRRAGLVDRLYPQATHVHYATLNGRDDACLRRAGMNPARLHILPNPVALDGQPAAGPRGRPGERLFLYPTRALRRKNLGELLLWAAIAPPGDRFAATLAPTAASDVRVYRRWKAVARQLELPVAFEVGRAGGSSLAALFRSASAIITTSVAEGFGLAFLEPWLAGRPLAGRDLPEITADFTRAGLDLDGLYSRLEIPLDWLGAATVRARLDTGRSRLLAAYGRTGSAADSERVFEAAVRGRRVEFGHLDESLQEAVVRALRADPARRRDLRPSDGSDLSDLSDIARNRAVVRTHYSLACYRRRLLAVYRAAAGSPAGALEPFDAAALLDQCLVPERFRLLCG